MSVSGIVKGLPAFSMGLGWLVHSVSECEQNVLLRGHFLSSEAGQTECYFPAGMHTQGQGLKARVASLVYSALQASLDPMRQLRQLLTLGKGRVVGHSGGPDPR
jgi:hypothetical protein